MAFAEMQNDNISDINHFIKARNEVDSWFFLSYTWPVTLILIAYPSFIYIDFNFFEKRKPINPKFIMLLFNIYQVVSNAYMVYVCLLPDTLDYLINHTCYPVDPPKNHFWYRGLYLGKLFMISKLADLLDTVFIVLRKKKSQTTFLHFYHHFCMVLFTWWCLKYYAGEQLMIVMLLNPLVHVVMYSYYTLTVIAPIQTYLWWKKYITILQLSQFVVYMIFMIGLIGFGCQHSIPLSLFVCLQASIFYLLFRNFYIKRYCQEKVAPATDSSKKVK